MAHNKRAGLEMNNMESSLVHQVVIDKEDWRHRPSLHQVSQLTHLIPDSIGYHPLIFFLFT